jgi:hypothetical protein
LLLSEQHISFDDSCEPCHHEEPSVLPQLQKCVCEESPLDAELIAPDFSFLEQLPGKPCPGKSRSCCNSLLISSQKLPSKIAPFARDAKLALFFRDFGKP